MKRIRTRFFMTRLLPLVLVSGVFIVSAPILTGSEVSPSYEQIRARYRSSDLQLRDRNGRILTEIRQEQNFRNLSWVEFSDIPENLRQIIIKSEDKNFYAHSGIDFTAILSAAYQRVFLGSQRGASTISMQTANLLDPQLKKQSFYKLRQLWRAIQIENALSKNQILEVYLNLVQFRSEFQGLRSASLALLKKEPFVLNPIDSYILAAMLRSPNAKWELIQTRACWLTARADDCDLIKDEIQKISQSDLQIPRPHQYAFQLGLRIKSDLAKFKDRKNTVHTTIDLDLQKYILDRLDSQILELANKNVRDGAVLVLDNHSGEVLAYVGGNPRSQQAHYIDHIQSYRQAGSTLKPFLYAAAFEREILTPNSWISDQAIDVVYNHGTYSPRNHNRQFSGWVPARVALASSLNVPAIRTFELLPEELLFEKLELLGFTKLKDANYYGPGLALGVADVTLWDLANAYRTLANMGIWSKVTYLPNQPQEQPRRVYSEKSAQTVMQVLSQSENRTHSFGFASVLDTDFPSIVKTGTSKDMRDNWCIGSSRDYTVAVWIGNSSGDSMWNVLGITGAAPMWSHVMHWLHEKRRSQISWPAVENQIAYPEIKLKELEQVQVKISYPSNNAILAFDPDLPAKVQKLPLTFEGDAQGLTWIINDEKIPAQDKQTLWPIRRGKYKITLVSKEKTLDSISILVK